MFMLMLEDNKLRRDEQVKYREEERIEREE